jgi:hypothetical protein
MGDRQVGVRFLAGAKGFSLFRTIQTGSSVVSPWVMWPGREADHSPPSNGEVKNGGAIPPLRHIFSWRDTY